MTGFFTDAFNNLPPDERETFCRTVFLQMDSPAVAELRRQYYATQLRRMGANVRIGRGVKIENPQHVSLGDNACIDDDCTLVARSERGITLGDGVNIKHRVYLDTEGADGYIEIGRRAYIGTGRDCYLGMGVCVLWSADIGDGAVIGSGSVVVKPIPPYSVAVGVPARVIRKRGEPLGVMGQNHKQAVR